jgi:hypothetical protein
VLPVHCGQMKGKRRLETIVEQSTPMSEYSAFSSSKIAPRAHTGSTSSQVLHDATPQSRTRARGVASLLAVGRPTSAGAIIGGTCARCFGRSRMTPRAVKSVRIV